MAPPSTSCTRGSFAAALLLCAAVAGCASGGVDRETESPAELGRRVDEERRKASKELQETLERRARRDAERQESQQRLVQAMRKDAAEKAQMRRDMENPRLRGVYELREQFRRQYGPIR